MAARKRQTAKPKAETAKQKKGTTKKAAPPLEPQNDRKSFLEALSFIKPGIATGSIIEQSDLVLMDNTRLVSYNDEIAVSHPFPIGYTGGVYANELHKLLQKLSDDEIEIGEAAEEGQNQIIIRCGTVEAGFYIVQDVTVPELGIDSIDKWVELPPNFCQGMGACLSAAATDVTKGVLTCIHAEGQVLMSCDNFRATRYELKEQLPEGVVLNIPRQAAKELAAYNPKEVGWTEEMNWIHFRNDVGTVFSTRTMAGDYPDVAGLFEGTEGKKIPLPKELKSSLGRVEILAAEDEKSHAKVVQIEIADKKIICSSQGQSGWATEKISTTYKEKVPQFSISPALLSQILDVAQEAVLTSRTLLFQGQGFAHVVALVADKK